MNILRPAIVLTLLFALATGLAFPALITGIAQTLFPHQANGSLIRDASGRVVGSEIVGQNFTEARYFHPRPSAAGGGYDAANSSGTNLGPTSDKLINGAEGFDGVKGLAEAYRKENGLAPDTELPADAVTRSASGLDPHISPANAELQIVRVAKARRLAPDEVRRLVRAHTDDAFVGIFGERAVNVLTLNRALDSTNYR
ncbi:K(+)-transporting ATPase subunit C [bacterium]|nr:MAG: K(+)-transporting ATPase subunit C [bacterium]